MTLPMSSEIHLGASSRTNSPGLILSARKFSSSRLCFSGSNRSLRVFRIPAKNDMFYSDIFGSDDDRDRERGQVPIQSKIEFEFIIEAELQGAEPSLASGSVMMWHCKIYLKAQANRSPM